MGGCTFKNLDNLDPVLFIYFYLNLYLDITYCSKTYNGLNTQGKTSIIMVEFCEFTHQDHNCPAPKKISLQPLTIDARKLSHYFSNVAPKHTHGVYKIYVHPYCLLMLLLKSVFVFFGLRVRIENHLF